MDFIDEIKALAARIPDTLEFIQTEEATKTALIMPFVRTLGYNTEDPREVVPEYIADVGDRKGEKVDYAIMKDGHPVILMECKAAGTTLGDQEAAQLSRYFTTTDVRFAVLTNGVVYRFYSDLDRVNRMDTTPFLEFNILQFEDALVDELKRFTKSAYDEDSTVQAATELKYTGEIKRILAQQLREPSDEFVRLFASKIHSGIITQAVRERFGRYTRAAFNQFINDRVYDRLRSAMTSEGDTTAVGTVSAPETSASEDPASDGNDQDIVTTDEELQAFYIVKTLLHDVVDVKRIEMRDAKSFCAIHLDHTNRKPICRLWFNRTQKYLGLIDEQKREDRVPIDDLDDIYQYANRLRATVRYYDQPAPQETPPESPDC